MTDTTQPEALRLAAELDAYHTRACHKQSAAELRRLHARVTALEAQAPEVPAVSDGRECYLCGHPASAHPMEPNPRGGMRRGSCPMTAPWSAPQPSAQAPAVPAVEPIAHLWQHGETGRTRVVMPDMIVDADAHWQVVGPLYLGAAPQPEAAVDERAAFERVFPMPSHCTWTGNGYAATAYSAWSAHTHCDRWEGWKARAALAAQGDKP